MAWRQSKSSNSTSKCSPLGRAGRSTYNGILQERGIPPFAKPLTGDRMKGCRFHQVGAIIGRPVSSHRPVCGDRRPAADHWEKASLIRTRRPHCQLVLSTSHRERGRANTDRLEHPITERRPDMRNHTANAASDIAAHLHSFTNLAAHPETGPFTVTRGDGVFVEDDQGNRYLEGVSGLWCASLGFSNARLATAGCDALYQMP